MWTDRMKLTVAINTTPRKALMPIVNGGREGVPRAILEECGEDNLLHTVVYPGIFFGRGGSTNSVEDRENGDLGAAAPKSGVLEAAIISYKKFNFI